MKLIHAGGQLEEVIEANKHELDDGLLKMLHKRAEAADR